MEGSACLSCARGELVMKAGGGRRMRYRHIPDLEIPEEVELPTCPECAQQWLDGAAMKRLEAALEEAYRGELVHKAEQAIETLRQHIPQRELERLLGVSAGWLSKVKKGKETSAPMAALLMLLAEQPLRVESLRRLWAVRPEPPRLFELAPVRVRVQSEPSRPGLYALEPPVHAAPPAPPALSLITNEELDEVAA